MPATEDVIGPLTAAARPLVGASDDYDYLLELIGDARLVLLGEATHGTHEFYHERAQITKRLIAEKSFSAVAVESGLAGCLQGKPLRPVAKAPRPMSMMP